MKIFVHSRARTLKHDYYWVELLDNGTTQMIASRTPHGAYDDLLSLIDGTSPSIILAQTAADELLLLIKGLASERLDGSSPRRTIYNALLLVFGLADEARARGFAAALLRTAPAEYPTSNDGFNSDIVHTLNGCISDGPSLDTYEVSPALRDRIEEIIGGAGTLDRAPLSGTLGAKNSHRFRQSLSEELARSALLVEGSVRKLRPFVVVTGEQDAESLVSAGANRMLTDQIRHEDDWYDFLAKPDQAPSRARAADALPPRIIRESAPNVATSKATHGRADLSSATRRLKPLALKIDVYSTHDRAGEELVDGCADLARELFGGGTCVRRQHSGGLGFVMRSVLADVVIFDCTVGPHGVHNYDLSPGIQRNFDHVLFVARSYLPMNVRGLRRGGAPIYPHSRTNDAILEWVREQLVGQDHLTVPRPLHERLSLGISAIAGASRRSRIAHKRQHQVFLSYRGKHYAEALKVKERIEHGEFHGGPRNVILFGPQELALEDEVLSPLQRWNVLSIISDVIMECEEFWVLEHPDYLASWWTRGELATYAYFGEQSRMRIYNLASGELRDAGEDYKPQLTEHQKSRMSRFFTNSHPDMMAPESTETMRLIASARPSALQSYARDQVFSEAFWHYPLLQCEDCASRDGVEHAFTIEGFLRNEYPVLYPISPGVLKRAERGGGTVRCPNEDCAAEYLIRPTPPRYLWYPIPVGPNKTSLEEFPTYRILRAQIT